MQNVCLSDFDFIGLSETWLSSNVISSELGLHNYITYRCDRNQNTSIHSRGGGVLLAVKNKFHSRLLPIPICPVEHIFVIIKIDNSYVIIGNVYFPPYTDISIYINHFDIINNLLLSFPYGKNIIMVGDYNLPKFLWHPSTFGFFPGLMNLNNIELEFISKLSFLNLFKFNNILNSTGSILDLVFSDLNNLVVNKAVNPLVPCDNYHPALLITIPMFIYEPIDYNLCKYNFLKCNYADITFSLASIDWYNQFKGLGINEAVDVFYSIIYDIIDIFVPKIIIRQSKHPL